MLPVSLDCPFLIAPAVFTNVYSAVNTFISQWLMTYSLGNTINSNNTNERIVLIKIYILVKCVKAIGLETDCPQFHAGLCSNIVVRM